MDRLITEFELEASRCIHQVLNENLLGQENGNYPRFKEQHMRVMIREDFEHHLLRAIHNPRLKETIEEHQLNQKDFEMILKQLKAHLGPLLKTKLKREKDEFNVENYIKDQNAIIKVQLNRYLNTVNKA
ncbi:hypothetical protein JXA48_01635 [Candidatus Woesearchaeota archaeon]|nr:hypothetical protein [Candidatus Woesearchaeota archaeon]